MSRLKKKIKVELSHESIRNAIAELEKFEKDLDDALLDTARDLTDTGEYWAKFNLLQVSEVYGGTHTYEIASSIHGEFDRSERTGHISTDDENAVYYEYGTGIVGKHAPHPGLKTGESKPPVMTYKDRTYTRYDTYDHGTAGWDYVENGEKIHTAGQPAGAFMYDTLRKLEELAPKYMKNNLSKVK